MISQIYTCPDFLSRFLIGIREIIRNSRDEELKDIIEMIKDLQNRDVDVYLNVNNHYEGCAPLTIGKIQKIIVTN